ncbi:MAG: zf-HC2 domain-containing protein [Acidobacteriota bacterium]
MNCKHIQELLPLYVGSDLEEKRAKLVTAHVQSCAECAASLEEYRETRQLVQRFAPPPFSEAVYTGIRQRVLRDIARESTPSTLPQLIASLFQPRLRWAATTAVLLVVSMFAFYFMAQRKNDQQTGPQRAENLGGAEQNNGDRGSNAGIQSDQLGTVLKPDPKATAGNPAPLVMTPRKPRLKMSAERMGYSRRAVVATAVPEESVAYSPVEPKGPALNTSEKTLRVEMQTKDRNIRIIWFSNQLSKQDSPTESSKGI